MTPVLPCELYAKGLWRKIFQIQFRRLASAVAARAAAVRDKFSRVQWDGMPAEKQLKVEVFVPM